MVGKVDYKYDQENRIFHKIYTGEVTFESLISSWEETLKNNEIPFGVKKFIIDYREADILFDHKKSKDIAEFYSQHDDVFGRSRIALVMVKPEHVIFPMIVESEDINFIVKPFYTIEAALKWLNAD